MDNEALVERR